jgi:DNA-binding beta-propeller fold protein YncE
MFARTVLGIVGGVLPAIVSAAQLLVLNKGDATLSFIEPSSGALLATVATGEGPHEVELSSDTKLAFVTNYGARDDGHTISVVDVQARKELRRLDLGDLKRPHGLTFAGGQVYFTSERAQKVGRLDPDATKIEWMFSTNQDGTHMVLASRDGNTLYATNIQSNTVSIIERGTGETWSQTLVAVGAGPEALDVSPDGRELWVGHSRDGGISIIDTATKRVAHTFDARTKRSNRLKFTHDGRFVLVSDLSGGELLIFDARTRTLNSRVSLGRIPTGILIPRGSPFAYVAVSGENHIAVVDLKTFKVTKTIAAGASPDGMAWLD